ncbi:MAG: monovalent cation/H(+) antiporter subunit G [Vicinamibacterales bacterium]
MTVLVAAAVLAGSLLLVVAAAGLYTLPDALARQHAATKAATLALGLILLGVGLAGGSAAWWIRVAILIVVLFGTMPVASHMLARAAVREAARAGDHPADDGSADG